MTHRFGADLSLLVRELVNVGWMEACAVVYTKRDEHTKVVECMLKGGHPASVFRYMRGLLGFSGEKPELQASFQSILLEHMGSLVSVDSENTAEFVLDYYVEERLHFMNALTNSPALQYNYLNALVRKKDILERKGTHVLAETHRRYLGLLCTYAPNEVLGYLRA